MSGDGFDLNASLRVYLNDPQTIPCNEADFGDDDDENEELSAAQINRVLDPIVDSVAVNPGAITKATAHDNVQYLLKYGLIYVFSEFKNEKAKITCRAEHCKISW